MIRNFFAVFLLGIGTICLIVALAPSVDIEAEASPIAAPEATPTYAPVFERPCAQWQIRTIKPGRAARTLRRGWEPVPGLSFGDIPTDGIAVGRCIEAVE